MSDDKIQPGLPAVMHLLTGVHEMIQAAPDNLSVMESSALCAQQSVMASLATVHALLAIETRLGELVEEHRAANILAIARKASALGIDMELEGDAAEHLGGVLRDLLKAQERQG